MMFALLTELYNTVYCSWSMAEFLKVDLDFNAAADYVVETPLQLSRDAGLLDGVQKVLIELCYRLPAPSIVQETRGDRRAEDGVRGRCPWAGTCPDLSLFIGRS